MGAILPPRAATLDPVGNSRNWYAYLPPNCAFADTVSRNRENKKKIRVKCIGKFGYNILNNDERMVLFY
jgi:hypothetical protein